MFGFLRKQPRWDYQAMLAGVPVRNELVREKKIEGGLKLAAPLRPGKLRRALGGRGAAVAEKAFELDELGAWVWGQLDGRRTVEGLIEDFARHFRVNVREAEVAVVAFLKTLTQRNLIAHVAPKAVGGAARRKKRR